MAGNFDIRKWAKEVIRSTGFVKPKLIYKGGYYSKGHIRNLIYSGVYKGGPSVLKIYNDPRPTDEPLSLARFHKLNKSELITAPVLYAYKVISPHQGWLIMQKLPVGGYFFKTPLGAEERMKFLSVYLEYRNHFPRKPTRSLILAERLPAHEFHGFRVNRWLEKAMLYELSEEMAGKKPILSEKMFLQRYLKGIELVRREFRKRSMVWCHGHFKPQEIYHVPKEKKYYVTDFAHTHLFPEGYELAFIIWADYLMSSDYKVDYKSWKKPVFDWIKHVEPVAKQLQLKGYKELITASLVERILGSILADVTANHDMSRTEKSRRLGYLYKLLDDLVRTYHSSN